MKLIVNVPFSHTYGQGVKKEEREIIAIRAIKREGAGDCIIYYQGKDKDGNWYWFLKKDNKNAKLPSLSKTTWHRQLVDVRGIRGVYELVTDEITLED